MSSSETHPRPWTLILSGTTQRRKFASSGLRLMIPIALASAATAFFQGRPQELWWFVATAVLFFSSGVGLKSPRAWLWLRFHLALLLAITLCQIADHQAEGYVFLWLYLVPLATFSFFGRREGTAWSIVTGVAAGALMLFGFGFPTYPFPLTARFLCSFAFTIALSFEVETVRNRYLRQLRQEKETLKKTLEDIELLQGFLPICASCKNIRDDQGFWKSVEQYLSGHSLAQVTRALCPACRAESLDESSALHIRDSGHSPAADFKSVRAGALGLRQRISRSSGFRQRRYLGLCFAITAVIGYVYGLRDLLKGSFSEAALELGIAVLFSVGLVAASKMQDLRPACLMFSVAITAFIGAEVYIGGASGYFFLWSTVLPPVFFTFFGKWEGLWWSLVVIVQHLILFILPGSYPYSPFVAFHFSFVLGLIVLVAFQREAVHQNLRDESFRERDDLERALAHTRTLYGILPMCPRCKDVRNDGGFWQQVEDYLTVHAGSRLTHSLCPACYAEELESWDTLPSIADPVPPRPARGGP